MPPSDTARGNPTAAVLPAGCPACASPDAQPLRDSTGPPLLRCRACATFFRPRDQTFSYDDYYPSFSGDVPAFIARRQGEVVQSFEPFRRTNRLLDVGFGAAGILLVARDAGWEAVGVEASDDAVEHARVLGLQ